MGVGHTDYRLRLRLLSPLGTPMQSDTLFGHLAWLEAWRGGEGGVREFLAPFLDGAPPFVLSGAFPAGLLPRPLFAAVAPDADNAGRRDFATARQRLKAPFVSAADFSALLAGPAAAAPQDSPWQSAETAHAAIDRNTWTTTPGGQLFSTGSLVLGDGFDAVDIYVRELAEGAAARVEAAFHDLALSGFGRDKSTGAGAFQVAAFDPWDGFSGPAGADGFVSLSTFMPAASDPSDGRWRVRVRRGRLGEMAGGGNPFKRPLIQIEPGAVFRAGGAPLPWYGRMVPGIAPGMPEAVQCGLTLAAPCAAAGRV